VQVPGKGAKFLCLAARSETASRLENKKIRVFPCDLLKQIVRVIRVPGFESRCLAPGDDGGDADGQVGDRGGGLRILEEGDLAESHQLAAGIHFDKHPADQGPGDDQVDGLVGFYGT